MKNPSDFIHALLSAHTYDIKGFQKEGEIVKFPKGANEKFNQYLTDWEIHHIRYSKEDNSFLGVIYVNASTKQMVCGKRGTALDSLSDFIGNLSANAKGVLFGERVEMQNAAMKLTYFACEKASHFGYSLSFTGHSLGGWLATQSLHWCKGKNVVAKAVTFDSPGTLKALENIEAKIDFHHHITHYVTNPNIVNSCGEQIGARIKINPQKTWYAEMVKDCASSVGFNLAPFITSGHSIDFICDVFCPISGLPRESTRITDWPTYEFKSLTPNANMARKHLNDVGGEFIGNATKFIIACFFENAISHEKYLEHFEPEKPCEEEARFLSSSEDFDDQEEVSLLGKFPPALPV